MSRKSQVKKRQEKWEKVLEEMQLPPIKDEISFDPFILDTLQSVHSAGYLYAIQQDSRLQDEKQEQIDRLRQLTMTKLLGRERECLILLLSGYDSYSEIGRKLGYSRDTVRRTLEQAGKKLKACLCPYPFGEFPSGGKEQLKTAVLPLDTDEERAAFQKFLNRRQVQQVSYSSGSCREALVVYQEE